MKILALDDSEPALKLLTAAIAEASPSSEIFAFDKPSELLAFVKGTVYDIAFLDIKMWGMNGLEVAKKLKDLNPQMNIIFVTAYTKYASEAFELYPSGYVLKPVTKEAVAREMENLRHPVDRKTGARIYAQTFGNFEVFVNGSPLKFSYSKTKELLAYLIDRSGAAANTNELCAVLWEEKWDSANLKAYFRKLVSDLSRTLEEADAGDILRKQRNSFAVIPEKIVCDYYGFLKYDPVCVNAYLGQYMAQYSWAEMTAGILSETSLK